MEDIDLGWIIGVIDASGSIILSKPKKGRRKLRITIKSSQVEMLEKCKDLLGGFICRATKKNSSKDSYLFVLGAELAYDFLDRNYRYFTNPQKRARAEHVSEFYQTKMTKSEIVIFEQKFFEL